MTRVYCALLGIALLLHSAAGDVNCTALACPFDCDPVSGCFNACANWNFDDDNKTGVYNPTCVARDVRSPSLCAAG